MHSKSPVVNLAEPSLNIFGEQISTSVQQKAVLIHLFIIHCFISLQYSQNINDCIIFPHFFSVGIGNELLWVCYILIILYTVRN